MKITREYLRIRVKISTVVICFFVVACARSFFLTDPKKNLIKMKERMTRTVVFTNGMKDPFISLIISNILSIAADDFLISLKRLRTIRTETACCYRTNKNREIQVQERKVFIAKKEKRRTWYSTVQNVGVRKFPCQQKYGK